MNHFQYIKIKRSFYLTIASSLTKKDGCATIDAFINDDTVHLNWFPPIRIFN